jgi:hypothetical protein
LAILLRNFSDRDFSRAAPKARGGSFQHRAFSSPPAGRPGGRALGAAIRLIYVAKIQQHLLI